MTGRDWKPGEMAIAFDADWDFKVVRHEADPDYWSAANGRWPLGVSSELLDYRPLVVIDPEDCEQVERLTKALIEACFKHGNLTVAHNGIHGDTTEAALREFANPTPPKPDEPTGLGAVVEDGSGARFVRTLAQVIPWIRADDDSDGFEWDDIKAVRVLSEGVIA